MPEKTINFRVVEVDKIEIETNQTLLEVGERARISYYLFAKGEGISPIFYDYKSFSLVGAESFERKSDETSAPILTAKKEGKYRIKGEMTSPKMLLSEKEIILEVYQPLKTNLASSRVKSAEI